jgi:hypothetical protein
VAEVASDKVCAVTGDNEEGGDSLLYDQQRGGRNHDPKPKRLSSIKHEVRKGNGRAHHAISAMVE